MLPLLFSVPLLLRSAHPTDTQLAWRTHKLDGRSLAMIQLELAEVAAEAAAVVVLVSLSISVARREREDEAQLESRMQMAKRRGTKSERILRLDWPKLVAFCS